MSSRMARTLPRPEISRKQYSSSACISQGAKYNRDDVKRDVKGTSAADDPAEVQTKGRQHARRSLHYDNNETVIDDATEEYVFSHRRRSSSESLTTERPRRRRRTVIMVYNTINTFSDDVICRNVGCNNSVGSSCLKCEILHSVVSSVTPVLLLLARIL